MGLCKRDTTQELAVRRQTGIRKEPQKNRNSCIMGRVMLQGNHQSNHAHGAQIGVSRAESFCRHFRQIAALTGAVWHGHMSVVCPESSAQEDLGGVGVSRVDSFEAHRMVSC